MKNKLKNSIYQLCKTCMALGFFFYFSKVSVAFFGEPDFPLEDVEK